MFSGAAALRIFDSEANAARRSKHFGFNQNIYGTPFECFPESVSRARAKVYHVLANTMRAAIFRLPHIRRKYTFDSPGEQDALPDCSACNISFGCAFFSRQFVNARLGSSYDASRHRGRRKTLTGPGSTPRKSGVIIFNIVVKMCTYAHIEDETLLVRDADRGDVINRKKERERERG